MALFELATFEPDVKQVRRICVSEPLADYLRVEENERAGRLLDDLNAFLKGNKLGISMKPREAGPAYMGLLDPAADCRFDIRSRDPRPALRVIGAFKEKDFFVGLVLRVRKTLLTDPDWDRAIGECDDLWRLHFQDSPLKGSDPDAFLTNWYSVD